MARGGDVTRQETHVCCTRRYTREEEEEEEEEDRSAGARRIDPAEMKAEMKASRAAQQPRPVPPLTSAASGLRHVHRVTLQVRRTAVASPQIPVSCFLPFR